MSHEGSKGTRAIFLRNGLVFTTGFSKMSERQYSLRAPDNLDEPIVMVELDTSNGVMFPLYDPDTNLVFLCGKVNYPLRHPSFIYHCYPSLYFQLPATANNVPFTQLGVSPIEFYVCFVDCRVTA